jgi:hypothetical protein
MDIEKEKEEEKIESVPTTKRTMEFDPLFPPESDMISPTSPISKKRTLFLHLEAFDLNSLKLSKERIAELLREVKLFEEIMKAKTKENQITIFIDN